MSTEAKDQDAGEVDAAATAEIAKGLDSRATVKPEATATTAKPAADPIQGKAAEGSKEAGKPEESNAATSALEAKLDALLKDNQELRKRVEGEVSREKRREAEDFRDDFIRNKVSDDFPRSLLRRLLPLTTDETQLYAAVKEIQEGFNQYAKKYLHKSRDIGGSFGGQTLSSIPVDYGKMSPTQAIAAGLARNRLHVERGLNVE